METKKKVKVQSITPITPVEGYISGEWFDKEMIGIPGRPKHMFIFVFEVQDQNGNVEQEIKVYGTTALSPGYVFRVCEEDGIEEIYSSGFFPVAFSFCLGDLISIGKSLRDLNESGEYNIDFNRSKTNLISVLEKSKVKLCPENLLEYIEKTTNFQDWANAWHNFH